MQEVNKRRKRGSPFQRLQTCDEIGEYVTTKWDYSLSKRSAVQAMIPCAAQEG